MHYFPRSLTHLPISYMYLAIFYLSSQSSEFGIPNSVSPTIKRVLPKNVIFSFGLILHQPHS